VSDTTANFELPPAIQALRVVVRDFADAEIRPRVEEFEQAQRIPDELVERMGDLGFLAAPFPEADGGAGAGELGFAVVQEELSRAHASTGLLVAAAAGLATRLVHSFGNEGQRARYLDAMLRGR
jgi:alkylation response protein AidB-like acyl-CoA dehydrogenase